jgi:hypothetical protein
MLVLHTSLTNCSFSQCPAKFTGANFELTESIKGCIVTGRRANMVLSKELTGPYTSVSTAGRAAVKFYLPGDPPFLATPRWFLRGPI